METWSLIQIDFYVENRKTIVIIIGLIICLIIAEATSWKSRKKYRKKYYRNVFLKSEVWRKQRLRVLYRDNYKCVYCNEKATEVHHKKYNKKIGTEPDKWLVSICRRCHNKLHN